MSLNSAYWNRDLPCNSRPSTIAARTMAPIPAAATTAAQVPKKTRPNPMRPRATSATRNAVTTRKTAISAHCPYSVWSRSPAAGLNRHWNVRSASAKS